MLDLKRIRNNPEEIKQIMQNRGEDFDNKLIDDVIALDERRRQILVEVEQLKSKRNSESSQIGKLKKEGKDTSAIMADMKKLSDDIKAFDVELNEVDEKIKYIMLRIPNIPNPNVPDGETDRKSVV